MRFVKLNDQSGREIYVNPDQIMCIEPFQSLSGDLAPRGAVIYTPYGYRQTVKESVQTVVYLFTSQGACV